MGILANMQILAIVSAEVLRPRILHDQHRRLPTQPSPGTDGNADPFLRDTEILKGGVLFDSLVNGVQPTIRKPGDKIDPCLLHSLDDLINNLFPYRCQTDSPLQER